MNAWAVLLVHTEDHLSQLSHGLGSVMTERKLATNCSRGCPFLPESQVAPREPFAGSGSLPGQDLGGADRAAEYPVMNLAEAGSFLEIAPIADADKNKIAYQNAGRLLRI